MFSSSKTVTQHGLRPQIVTSLNIKSDHAAGKSHPATHSKSSIMDWAVIAPDERLFRGNMLFKWDQSPGLGKNKSKHANMRS